jgi:hypothetical protein
MVVGCLLLGFAFLLYRIVVVDLAGNPGRAGKWREGLIAAIPALISALASLGAGATGVYHATVESRQFQNVESSPYAQTTQVSGSGIVHLAGTPQGGLQNGASPIIQAVVLPADPVGAGLTLRAHELLARVQEGQWRINADSIGKMAALFEQHDPGKGAKDHPRVTSVSASAAKSSD